MITNLFLIGNGFDGGHGMKTGYGDFKKWLTKSFPESDSSNYENEFSFFLNDPIMMPDGDEYIPDKDLASFLKYCIEETTGGNWSNFESALGEIEWKYFYDQVEDVEDSDGDIDFWKTAYAREDFTHTLSINSKAFSKLFSEWISTIDYPNNVVINNFLSNKIINTSFFITFNYTKTLEDIYGIPEKQVFHIHGVQGGAIIIGHGHKCDQDDSEYDFGMEGIDEIHEFLRKPTEKIIQSTNIFKQLQSFEIKNIYSWGFSFSEVDQCYIQEICKNLDTNLVTWHLHDYSSDKFCQFKNILRTCGFGGEIKSFHA